MQPSQRREKGGASEAMLGPAAMAMIGVKTTVRRVPALADKA